MGTWAFVSVSWRQHGAPFQSPASPPQLPVNLLSLWLSLLSGQGLCWFHRSFSVASSGLRVSGPCCLGPNRQLLLGHPLPTQASGASMSWPSFSAETATSSKAEPWELHLVMCCSAWPGPHWPDCIPTWCIQSVLGVCSTCSRVPRILTTWNPISIRKGDLLIPTT